MPILLVVDAWFLVAPEVALWLTLRLITLMPWPLFAILALVIIVTLAVAKSPGDQDDIGLWQRYGLVGKAGWAAAVVATVLGVISLVRYVAFLDLPGESLPLLSYALWLVKIARILCIAALIPFVWIIARELVHRRASIAP